VEHPDSQVGRSSTPPHDPQPRIEITTTAKARRWIEVKSEWILRVERPEKAPTPLTTWPPDILRYMPERLSISALLSATLRPSEPATHLPCGRRYSGAYGCPPDRTTSRTAAQLVVCTAVDGGDPDLLVAPPSLVRWRIAAQVDRLLLLQAGAACHLVTGEGMTLPPYRKSRYLPDTRASMRNGYSKDDAVAVDITGSIRAHTKSPSARRLAAGSNTEVPRRSWPRPRSPRRNGKKVGLLCRPLGHAGLRTFINSPRWTRSLRSCRQVLTAQIPLPHRTLAALAPQGGPLLSCSYAEASAHVDLSAERPQGRPLPDDRVR
jgi:hypothetical protein